MSFENAEHEYTQEQFKNAQFSIEDTRIILYMKGKHCGYCTDEDPAVIFDFNEYKNYFNTKSILKDWLKNQN
jgi:hypothetical protein